MLLRLPPLLLVVSAVAAQAATATAAERPHSRVVTYAHGVRVSRLQLELRRDGHALRGDVSLTAASTTGHALIRTLSVGRCLHGVLAAPSCPATTRITVRVPASGNVSFTRPVSLRQPSARFDSVEARLQDGVGGPFYHGDAELLVRGRAWRGVTAGQRYGVVLTPQAHAQVERLSVDGPATAQDELYADAVYTASGTRLETPVTSLLRSPSPKTTTATVLDNRRGSGPKDFRDRFDVQQQGATAFGLLVTNDTGALAQVRLPWPTN